jgi:hypothetical protein
LLHDRFVTDKAAMTAADVASLKALGTEILARKYETKHSVYVYEKPDEVKGRETNVDDVWGVLETESTSKRPILDDHLARNEFQEKLRLWVKNHKDTSTELASWHTSKAAYLRTGEQVASSETAKFQLALLNAYAKSKENKTTALLHPMKSVGDEIRTAIFESQHSRCVLVFGHAVPTLFPSPCCSDCFTPSEMSFSHRCHNGSGGRTNTLSMSKRLRLTWTPSGPSLSLFTQKKRRCWRTTWHEK